MQRRKEAKKKAPRVYTLTGGNACGAGIDFIFFSGTLSWANNDANTKSFAVPLCADSLNEGDETVNLTLSSITGSATLGTRTTATLTITNDDGARSVYVAE